MKQSMYSENCLIIGGSSGIGLSVAKKLAKKNYRCILVSSSADKLNNAKSQLCGFNHEVFAYDLSDVEHIGEIFSFLQEKKIRLDSMVYCAGISPLCLLKDNTSGLMEKVYRINLFSFIECCKYFYMEQFSCDNSKIVAVTSITAHKSGYRQVLYGSSKAAILAAARLMAKELLNRGIKINCVSPGCVDTEMLSNLYKNADNMEQRIRTVQPIGIIPPDKVAEMICMLISPMADYITGTEIMFDAGSMLT